MAPYQTRKFNEKQTGGKKTSESTEQGKVRHYTIAKPKGLRKPRAAGLKEIAEEETGDEGAEIKINGNEAEMEGIEEVPAKTEKHLAPNNQDVEENGDNGPTKEIIEQHPLSNPKIFWKLACLKSTLTLVMCNDCREECFHSGLRKFSADPDFDGGKGRIEIKLQMCGDCARANFEIADAWLRMCKRKRGEQ